MSAAPFIITGLPRSRSAWLANLFTHGPSHCFHDVLADIGTLEELPALVEMLGGEGKDHVGFADTALPYKAAQLMALLPEAKWIIVLRDQAEAVASYVDYFTRHPYPGQLPPEQDTADWAFGHLQHGLDLLHARLPRERLRVVEFEELNDEATVQMLWEFILPGVPWCPRRFRLLNGLNINTLPGKSRGDAARTAQLMERE